MASSIVNNTMRGLAQLARRGNWQSVFRRGYASQTEMTVRDALNSALAEEMRKDDKVFVMGEEVGEYQGAYKITRGLLQEFGSDRVYDTPITEVSIAET
mmetsp:Transcript_5547/g.10099  ORF Transcript_5547/g.10099 Transcript_5547/m.10099 type:complete len:99 (-) Transcript_5547:999-1295(-)